MASPPTMSARRGHDRRDAPARQRRGVAYRQREELTRDRLPGLVLATLVVLVQLTWGGMLVYLGFHFL
jgi:hypothetical protein